MELLEVGGKLVYSTCSMNPVEDEAVVQRMILDAGKENVVIKLYNKDCSAKFFANLKICFY